MKWEQRRFIVSPSVVPTGKPVTVTIKGYGDYFRFFDDITYIVKLIPKEKRDYIINDDFNINADECNTVKAHSKDGVLSFEYTFEGEQEWKIQLMAEGGQDKHFNRWRLYFKELWNQKQFDSFNFDFRIYSLEQDLYALDVFKGDTHTHTEYSDGNDTPELFCANYRGFGYDFVAITDHYEYSSSLRAIEEMSKIKTNFTVFPGEEVHVIPSGGRFHIVNFNGKSSVNTRIIEDYEGVKAEVFALAKELDRLSERDAQELAWTAWITNEIRKTGGLSIYAHPFITVSNAYNCPTHITVEALKRGFFDAYEILNADSEQERNIQAALYYDLKCQGYKIPIVGSTDAHISSDHGVVHAANFSTLVFAKSADEIPDAIMDLRSTAVSHTVGQTPYVHGSFRLTKYSYFLIDNYFPMHNELCKASSVMLCEYFKGHKEVEPAIEIAEKRIAEFKKSFFGK